MNPFHQSYENAEIFQFAEGITMKLLMSGSDCGGVIEVFEDIVQPGYGPPRHIHHKQDETFSFLEGIFDVEIDGELIRAKAGDTAFIPKGSIHAWKNVGETTGILRYILSPALNIEQMFRATHEAKVNGTLNEEMYVEIGKRFPEQETVGSPL